MLQIHVKMYVCMNSGTLSNKAKRTAGHLLVSHVICIVMQITEKQGHVGAENKGMCQSFSLSNLRLFLCIQSSNADKFKVIYCHGHNLNTDSKRRLFKFRKGLEVLKEEI